MKKAVLLAFVFCLLSTALSLCVIGLPRLQIAYASPHTDNFDFAISNSVGYVSVPFHYQSKRYYCGPAALEMVFNYYGEDIPQTEIADVARTYPSTTFTDELRRAAHFSNLSTSLGDEMLGNITGYSARKVGYAAFEHEGLNIDALKLLINQREPLIVLMWQTPSKVYGHYRVVVGHNETHIIMHDPWNKNLWGGTYGGANTSMAYSTFLDLWEYSGYWGLWVHPWDIELQMPSTVSKGDNFEVKANITYPCSAPFDTADYPASSCKASIELQPGLELGLGETPQHSLGNITAGDSVQTSWSINASEAGFHNISVTVTGIVGGSVWAHGTYPSYNYEDEIGGSFTKPLSITHQTYRVHNIDSGKNFSTIQGAINDTETLDGHTILVDAGTYYEHVTIDKSISLIGEEDIDKRAIITNETDFTVYVSANNVTISGFEIRNSEDWGIILNHSSNSVVSGNIVKAYFAILVEEGSGNKISDNDIEPIEFCIFNGLKLANSDNNVVTGNHVPGSSHIAFEMVNSNHNYIAFNYMSGHYMIPIRIDGCNNNSIIGNTIASSLGSPCIFLWGFGGNVLYHNNFRTSDRDPIFFYDASMNNTWDDGYPSGGNYWSDYNGTDNNQDGIGDSPYVIDENNQDNYPLMGMFSDFTVWDNETYHVTTICNSTISDFHWGYRMNINGTWEKALQFNVLGPEDTIGFCRITIPRAFMEDPYTVLYTNEVNATELPISNSTHAFLYITYTHSGHVMIIPEFPTWTSILLILIVLTAATAIYKRRLLKTPTH